LLLDLFDETGETEDVQERDNTLFWWLHGDVPVFAHLADSECLLANNAAGGSPGKSDRASGSRSEPGLLRERIVRGCARLQGMAVLLLS
jgi:hypothetical protein